MTRLRVLHVSQPVDAGVPAVVGDYVKLLARVDVEVAVACPRGPLSERVAGTGAEWLPWEAGREPSAAVFGEVLRLRQVIARWNPDVVHLHSAKAGLCGRLAVRGRLPTVFQPHAWSFEAVHGLLRKASAAWEARASRWSDVTVCVSEAERRTAERHGIRGNIVVVPNRVDTVRWAPVDQLTARAEAGAPLEAPIAVCVGRLCEQKGQVDLVRVWRDVRAAVPDATLVLVGDGPDRERIVGQAAGSQEGIHVVGHTADVASWFAVADVVVAPSRWEAMAMVPLEAQASGRAVIATDVAGMAEALGAGGVIVPRADHEALRSALVRELRDRPGLARSGRAARRHALARPEWEELAPRLLEIYRSAGVAREPHHDRVIDRFGDPDGVSRNTRRWPLHQNENMF